MPSALLSYALNTLVRTGPRRPFKNASRCFSAAIPLPIVEVPAELQTPPQSSVDTARQKSVNDLEDALARSANPSRVWAHYTALLNFLGYQKLPLEIHQEVLRRCTASSAELRVSAPRRLLAGNIPESPHLHEGRFQTIIRNIRAMGAAPTLNDYHFILEQFAAVGHYRGSMQVFKELMHIGLAPTTKTFGLCLQAIAHRLTLPIFKNQRVMVVDQARKMLADLTDDMRRAQVPLTPANFDLTFRILKETLDNEGLESLLKWGYGVDLANPDRVPLEYLESRSASDINITQVSSPMPFTSAALNTALDILGRLGNISKLIQAFEVLTEPLPQASQHFFMSFDDDEFGVVPDINAQSNASAPYAPPNTTTYNILLRHVCKNGHAVLARHYILQAMLLEKETAHVLRTTVSLSKSLEGIQAPHFAINRGTLLSVLGISNRDKNMGLMRWLSTKIPVILKNKKSSLTFYNSIRNTMERVSVLRTKHEHLHNRAASAFLPLPPRSSGGLVTGRNSSKTSPIFDHDLDAAQPALQSRIKPFDIDLHIKVLQRDIHEITAFSSQLESTLGRNTQRVKERLGRRVWAGKNIYISTEAARSQISRDRWRTIVGFKPRKNYKTEMRVPPSANVMGRSSILLSGRAGKSLTSRSPPAHFFERSFATLRQTSGGTTYGRLP